MLGLAAAAPAVVSLVGESLLFLLLLRLLLLLLGGGGGGGGGGVGTGGVAADGCRRERRRRRRGGRGNRAVGSPPAGIGAFALLAALLLLGLALLRLGRVALVGHFRLLLLLLLGRAAASGGVEANRLLGVDVFALLEFVVAFEILAKLVEERFLVKLLVVEVFIFGVIFVIVAASSNGDDGARASGRDERRDDESPPGRRNRPHERHEPSPIGPRHPNRPRRRHARGRRHGREACESSPLHHNVLEWTNASDLVSSRPRYKERVRGRGIWIVKTSLLVAFSLNFFFKPGLCLCVCASSLFTHSRPARDQFSFFLRAGALSRMLHRRKRWTQ